MVTQERLKELFDYHEDGFLVRKVYVNGGHHVGEILGCEVRCARGIKRWRVCVDTWYFFNSTAVWVWHNGPVPDGLEIDHRDRNQLNDRIGNLRPATRSQNAYNRRMRSDNKTGYKGLQWDTKRARWLVQVSIGKKRKHLGYFKEVEDALACRAAWVKERHGEFSE